MDGMPLKYIENQEFAAALQQAMADPEMARRQENASPLIPPAPFLEDGSGFSRNSPRGGLVMSYKSINYINIMKTTVVKLAMAALAVCAVVISISQVRRPLQT